MNLLMTFSFYFVLVVVFCSTNATAQSSIECFSGIIGGDVNLDNNIDVTEYTSMLIKFAADYHDSCTMPSNETTVRQSFDEAACSCQSYTANPAVTVPPCVCSEDTATVALPWVYPAAYSTAICKNIEYFLEVYCKTDVFSPTKLRTPPSMSPATQRPLLPSNAAELAQTSEQDSNLVETEADEKKNVAPVVASVLAGIGVMCGIAALFVYKRRQSQRKQSTSSHEWSIDYDEKVPENLPTSPNSLASSRSVSIDGTEIEEAEEGWLFGAMVTDLESPTHCHSTNQDFAADSSNIKLYDVSLDAPEPIFSVDKILPFRLSLEDVTPSPVCDYDVQGDDMPHIPTETFEDPANYNDVWNYGDDCGDKDGANCINSSSEDDCEICVGPVDIDSGVSHDLPLPSSSSSFTSRTRKKSAQSKKISAKRARELYMTQAQWRSTSRLKPIPEATLTRARKFSI